MVSKLSTLFAPDINTSKYFSKNRGKKAIFYATKDNFVGIQHVKENIQTVINNRQGNQLSVFAIPGEHATSLIDNKSQISELYAKEIEKFSIKFQKLIEQKINLINLNKNETNLIKKNENQSEIDKIEKEINEINEKIDFLYTDISVGQNQLDLFLKKANLSQPIIENWKSIHL